MAATPDHTEPPGVPLIEGYALGPFQTNCYIIHVPPDPECWIIDASFQPEPLLDRTRDLGLRPSKLILTHAHIDHIAGIPAVLRAFPGLPIIIHEAERNWLTNPRLNLSAAYGEPFTTLPPTELLKGDEQLSLGEARINVLHTPGHSPGGITLYAPDADAAIVGDTLFAGSIGRFDFPTSDEQALYSSIRTHLYTLPDSTQCFPGHGPPTTIGVEKQSNPFVRP